MQRAINAEKEKEESTGRRKIHFLRRRNLLENKNVTIADTHKDRQTDTVKIGLEFWTQNLQLKRNDLIPNAKCVHFGCLVV